MLDTANMWYGSKKYSETLVTFVTLKSYMLDCFIPSEYVRRAGRALVACKMGERFATEYIDDFRKHLANCIDM